jgi:hypothetical protein
VSPTASGGGIGDVDVDVAGAEGTGTEDQTVDGGKKEEVEMIPTTPADDSKLDEQAKKGTSFSIFRSALLSSSLLFFLVWVELGHERLDGSSGKEEEEEGRGIHRLSSYRSSDPKSTPWNINLYILASPSTIISSSTTVHQDHPPRSA